jgi:aryl-alcohol dehydrogenase-like predicted oxidoreductase
VQQRTLGTGGPTVSAIGLGCMGMSWAYGQAEQDDATSAAVLAEAVESGVSFFDTADVYGLGANEELVGPALAPFADRLTLATKAGLVSPDRQAGSLVPDGRPEHLREAVDASLRRLGREVIDLYYLHRVDPAVPLAESWSTMAEFVTAGKVKAIGLSEVTVAQLDAAQAIHPVAAVQSEFSLWTRGPAGVGVPPAADSADGAGIGSLSAGAPGDVIGWTAANGAALVPFAPLGRGFLTGAFDAGTTFADGDFRSHNPRFAADALAANQRIVDEVRAVAAEAGGTPAQVAIAWVLAQGEHIVPIPGTKRSKYLQENIGAAELALTADQLDRLSALPAPTGERY